MPKNHGYIFKCLSSVNFQALEALAAAVADFSAANKCRTTQLVVVSSVRRSSHSCNPRDPCLAILRIEVMLPRDLVAIMAVVALVVLVAASVQQANSHRTSQGALEILEEEMRLEANLLLGSAALVVNPIIRILVLGAVVQDHLAAW